MSSFSETNEWATTTTTTTTTNATMPRAWTDDDAPFARDGMQAHERVKALVETLEVTKARDARRETTLALCEQMRVGGASAMSYAMSIGARGMLIKALNLAMREGDEEAMDAVGNALGKASRPANREASVELRAVAGSQVGARASMPAGTLRVRLPVSGFEVGVCESEWKDAGLAWRVWGAGQIMARCFDAAPELVRDLSVLEIGAGCGVCGLVAARLGASRAVVTDGAPGALDAIRRSVVGLPEECARNASAAFFDFRDDQDVLNGTVSIEDARAGTGVDHWVHSRPHALKATTEACKLPVDETFDVVVATDVLYSDDHAGPLAASFIRRMKPSGRGFILNACRNGTLIAHFIQHLLAHGIAVRISAAERFDGEREFSQYEGGHLHRHLPDTAEAWWNESARTLAQFAPAVIADEEATRAPGFAETERLESFATALEGRFVLLDVRPTSRA